MLIESLGGIPIGCPGRPDEVAEPAAFLSCHRKTAARESEYVIEGGTLPTV